MSKTKKDIKINVVEIEVNGTLLRLTVQELRKLQSTLTEVLGGYSQGYATSLPTWTISDDTTNTTGPYSSTGTYTYNITEDV